MPTKRYSFTKILIEYNKEFGHSYIISRDITDITIRHENTSTFCVNYTDEGDYPATMNLETFISHYISMFIPTDEIIRIILHKEEENGKLKMEILPSNKIRYAYLCTNYFSGGGCLGSSCMRHKENQKSLNFYIKNNVKIIVLTDKGNKIHARALLWENVKSTDRKTSFTYLDRVYSRSDSFITPFKELAVKNKWKYYSSTSAGRGKAEYYIDNIITKGICHLPYTDTFRFLFYKNGIIAGSTNTGIKNLLKHKDDLVSLVHTTEGGYQPALDKDRVKEVCTTNFISKKDGVFVKRYNGFVAKKNIADVNGNYYSRYDKNICESPLDGFMLKENSVAEVFSGATIDKTKATYSIEYKEFIHKSNVVDIKGRDYHKQDTEITCFDNKWYHISQCFINYDREKHNAELATKSFRLLINNEIFLPSFSPNSAVTRKEGEMIPQKHAIIAYDLIYNPIINDIEYQVVYVTTKEGLIQLNTHEYIINSPANKKYLKKFNNKWYIKETSEILLFADGKIFQRTRTTCKDFKLPDKKQLIFTFMEKK